MRIASGPAFAQGRRGRKYGCRRGLCAHSHRDGRGLPAGRLRQRRDRSRSADSVDRPARPADDAGAGGGNPGRAVAGDKHLAGRRSAAALWRWRAGYGRCSWAFAPAHSSARCCFRMMTAAVQRSGSAWRLWCTPALGLIKVHFSVPRHAEIWLGLLMGAATGAITVATGIFVMPGTPYVQSLQFDRDKMVQALGPVVHRLDRHARVGARLCRAGEDVARRAFAAGACRGACWDVARASGARESARRNIPVVLLHWSPGARCASGAARAVVID